MGDLVKESDAAIARSVRSFYVRMFLKNERPVLLHRLFGTVETLPTKSSKTIRFRKTTPLSANTVPLSEGITPTGTSMTITEVNVSVKSYGDFILHSDEVDLISEDPIITKMVVELGEQAGLTFDHLTRDVIVAGTNVIYANGAARTSVNTLIAINDIKTAVRTLRNNKTRKVREIINPTVKIGTSPVDASYFAIVHEDLVHTVRGFTDFVKIEKYGTRTDLIENEFGAVENVRFASTTEAKIFTGGGAGGGSNVKETSAAADVYVTLITGRDAYHMIKLGASNVKIIIKAVGSSGVSDALDQRGSVGWKGWDANLITNQLNIVRIESAAEDAIA